MSARLRSDLWVAAYLRRCQVEGVYAVLRRRGAAEAGAIFITVDCLDGRRLLFGPAPQSLASESGERLFTPLHGEGGLDGLTLEARLARELKFDSDLWIVDVDDRSGRHFLDLAQ